MAGLSIGDLLLPNLTLELNSQITIRITAPVLPNYSDSPVLVTGLP
jgi:hypothetical protein